MYEVFLMTMGCILVGYRQYNNRSVFVGLDSRCWSFTGGLARSVDINHDLAGGPFTSLAVTNWNLCMHDRPEVRCVI